MSKETVISIRNALKAGKNLPLKVYADNDFIIVDESNAAQFTKWDDTNGVLYTFRLMSFDQSRTPNNSDNAISVGAILYEFIQAMEVAPMPLKNFDDLMGSMAAEGINMSTEFKDHIKHVFTELLHKDRWKLSPSDINAIHGANLRTKEDQYYAGHFSENFKETRDHAIHNQKIDEANSGNNP